MDAFWYHPNQPISLLATFYSSLSEHPLGGGWRPPIKQIIYPNGVFPLKYRDEIISENFLTSVLTFVFLYIFIFFIFATLISLTGLDFITSISAAATSISNVGPGLGEVIGPNGSFQYIPDISKWYLTFGMLLGRLEFFTVLVLFLPSFWRN